MTFWVVGHRGSPVHEPENTIPSFARAIADGANAVELDVCLTSDGEVVLWHDADPREPRARFRQLGLEPFVRYRPRVPRERRRCRPVRELTLTQLRTHFGYAGGFWGRAVPAHIPSLSEFFEWACGQRRLDAVFLDVKLDGEHEAEVRHLLGCVDDLCRRFAPRFLVLLETAARRVGGLFAAHDGPYARALDVEPPPGLVTDHDACSAVRAAVTHGMTHAAAQRPRGITIRPFATHRRIVAADLARLARHNAARPSVPLDGLFAFTINREAEMRELIQLGVSAIQSDHPGLLRKVADEQGKRRQP